MNVIVCMKQVVDPEAPVSAFKIDAEAMKVLPPGGTPPVLNPFDENALEAALKIKDGQETKITVISMGKMLAKPIVQKSLAAGADELVTLEDNVFDDLDSYATAAILAAAIKKIGEYDLILCGRQASDTDAGQTGSGIAEILDLPSVTEASKIEASGGKATVERVVSDGCEIIEVPLPALVTVSNEIGELRAATVKAIMEARKKPVTTWNAGDLEVEPAQLKKTNLLKLYQPTHEGECEIIEAASEEEAGIKLALKLREDKII